MPAPPASAPPKAARSDTARPRRALGPTLRRILGLARAYRGRLLLGLLLTLLASAVWLLVPLGLRELLDAVFEVGNRTLLDGLTVALIGLFLVQTVLNIGGWYLLAWVGERVMADLRQRLYAHLHRLGLRFYANQRTGELTSRLTNDVGKLQTVVTDDLAEAITQAITLVGSAGLMFVLNWRLALLIFATVPVVTLVTRYAGSRLRALSRQIQDRLAETTAIAEEALSAIRVVKAFAREPFETGRYAAAVEDLFGTARHRALFVSVFWSSVGLLFMGVLVAVFWVGGGEVLAGRLTAGDLVAFIFYALNIARAVGGMARLYASYNGAAGASERLFELLDTAPEIVDAPDATVLPTVAGHVAVEDLWFGYEPERPILKGLTFTVEPGQTVALVGPSGAGKTTLLHLLLRFYDPTRGAVRLDGYDLRAVTQASLRSQLSLVAQDVQLFATSIRENIRYGRLDATDAEVEAAAQAANAHAFIAALPGGYDAPIGEKGVKLSGGQRQRLAIARALLKNPHLLLLDEATSALDTESEAAVQEAFARLMQGRTSFVIAHRLATVRDADRILVLDDGQVVQDGTHDALMAEDGLYRRLAARQFREEPV